MKSRCARGLVVLVIGSMAVLLGGFTATASAASYSATPAATWIPNGTVYAMAESNGVVYIGGTFTSLKSPTSSTHVTRNRLAAIDAATGVPLPWSPSADDTVRALSVGPDGTIYAGGDFLNVNGAPATRIDAINPDGTNLGGFSASANSTVRKISASAAGLYVAGNFGRFNGKALTGIAKVDPSTGATVSGWNAAVTGGRVRSLALSPNGTDLIVGGSFTALSGQPRLFLGAVALDTGAVSTWTPASVCDSCQTLDITSGGGRIFTATGGGGGGRVAAYSLSSNNRLWVKHGDGDVQSVAYNDNVVYAGGHFGPDFDGQLRHQLVALDPATGTVQSYSLPMTGNDHPGIWAIVVDASFLRIGGGFRLATAPEAKYAALPMLG